MLTAVAVLQIQLITLSLYTHLKSDVCLSFPTDLVLLSYSM